VHVCSNHFVGRYPDGGQNGHLSVQYTDIACEFGFELGATRVDGNAYSGCELWRLLIFPDGVDLCASNRLARFDLPLDSHRKDVTLGDGDDFHFFGGLQNFLGTLHFEKLAEAAERR
jgi:hypothetical protein